MVEGRRRAIGTTSNNQVTQSTLARSRSVRQSVRSNVHRQRDLSTHRSTLGTNSGFTSDNTPETLSTGEKCKEFARSFVAFIFSKVGLIVLVVGYAIGGALLFQAVEGPHEDKEMHYNQVSEYRNQTLNDLWNITTQLNIFSKETWSERIDARIKKFQTNLIEQIHDNGYDGSLSPQWTFSGSFLFALTVITTIGYGNIAPRTDEGKITTILYAIFGIPLMLLYLTNIGGILARSFRFVYGKFCLCGNRRKAMAAVNRSRSIRMQRQRSILTASPQVGASSRVRSAVTKPPTPVLKNAPSSAINQSPKTPSTSDSGNVQRSASAGAPSNQVPSEESSPQTPGPSGEGGVALTTPVSSSSKSKSVTIAGETSSSSAQQQLTHRPQFIPYSSSAEQQYQAYYQHQISMSSQSTGDGVFSEMPMASPHLYDPSFYPYHGGYNVYGQMGPAVTLPPPVSTLIAASSLGSAPAMSSTAAKAHCTRAAAITASASHAISAAASSSSSQDKVHVPISLCLMILVAYVSGGGFLFSIWEEDWGYLEGSYFCFISLSTIGFGDLVPGDAVVAGEGGSQERLIICSLYLLTGLALIAMCFNLMQEEVIHKVRKIGQNIGIIKDPEIDQDESDEDEDEEDEEEDENEEDAVDNRQDNVDGTLAMSNINVDQVTSGAGVNQSQMSRQMYAPSYHESPVTSGRGGDASMAGNLSPLSMRRQPFAPVSPHFPYPGVPYSSPPPSAQPPPPPLSPVAYGGGVMLPPMMYSPSSPQPPPPFASQPPQSPLMQSAFPPYNWTSGHS